MNLRQTRPFLGTVAVALILGAMPVLAAGSTELSTLDSTWSKVEDYQATIVAVEFSGSTQQERRFHFSYLRPDHVKAEILDGALRGMVAIWNGGDKVTVYHHGMLAGLRVGFPLHDHMVTSPRGNTVASANFGAALECYLMHPELVHTQEGPEINGAATMELVMESTTPLQCPGSSEKDSSSVTKDSMIVDGKTNLPLRRLRYAGDTLVEQWDIKDLRVNTGLKLTDFR